MLPPVIVAYVGDEERGLDIVRVLDRRLNRPVHLLTLAADAVGSIIDYHRLDCVICGASLGAAQLQTVVDTVAAERSSLPLFDLTGDIAAVPDGLNVHHIFPGVDPLAAADELVGIILDTTLPGTDDAELLEPSPRSLGRYVAVDEEWVVTDWDPRLDDWTGLEPSAVVGDSLWDAVPDWEGTELAILCRSVWESRESTTKELYHDPLDRWFEARAVAVETGGIELFFRDITEYKQIEVELQEKCDDVRAELEATEQRFENTLDRITDAFFALDNEERFVLLNSHAEFVLDVDAEQVEGVRFWDAFPAAVSTTFYQEFNEAMETQEPTSFEEYYRPLDSWFEVNAYPSEDGLSVFLRDVTEQVELQSKLEELHEVTRDLIVAEADEDIAAGTVKAAEDVLDFQLAAVWRHDDTTETLIPLSWSDGIDERVDEMEPLDRESEFIWEVFDTEESRELGFVPATTSNSHHPGKVTSELLVPLGEYGVMGAYSDERDAFDETDVELYRILASTAESAFARARRERQLARQNERLDDFASIVSHDLRNPLNIASAHTELARGAEDPSEHLDKVETSLHRMESLIEDLLARARGDQGLDRERLSLAGVAETAWGGVDTKEATLRLDGDAELNADRDRLRQLFENLFRNAIDHGREDVTVRVGSDDDGFFVADDGPGIPDAEKDGIFEQGITYSEDGTGYGLAIVTDVVEGHGWRIEVSDSVDDGARFEVHGVYSLVDAPDA